MRARGRPLRVLPQRAHSSAHLALRDRAAPVELGEARGFRTDARAQLRSQPSGYRNRVADSRARLHEEELNRFVDAQFVFRSTAKWRKTTRRTV